MQSVRKYNIMMPGDGMDDPLALEMAKRLAANPWPSLGVAREKTHAFRALFGIQLHIENVTASVKRVMLS